MLLDKNLIFAFFLLFRRLQSCGPGNGGGRTWLWLHQCLICRCKFPFPIFQFMMPYFDDIFWALKQNLQKNIVFLSYLNVSFRFRFFHDALFWRYFFFFNKFQHYEFEFSRIFRTIRTNPGYFLFIIFSSYVDVSFRFRFSNVLQVDNFQKVSFVYHFIEEILHDCFCVE